MFDFTSTTTTSLSTYLKKWEKFDVTENDSTRRFIQKWFQRQKLAFAIRERPQHRECHQAGHPLWLLVAWKTFKQFRDCPGHSSLPHFAVHQVLRECSKGREATMASGLHDAVDVNRVTNVTLVGRDNFISLSHSIWKCLEGFDAVNNSVNADNGETEPERSLEALVTDQERANFGNQ